MKDRSYIAGEIATRAADNTSGAITAADLRALLELLNDSAYNRLEEQLGLLRWQPGRAYAQDELTYRAGRLYISSIADNTGNQPENSPSAWAPVTLGSGDPPNLSLWDNTATYAQDDYVEYQAQFYRSLQDNNTGHPPDSSPTWWQPVSGAQGFGEPYQPNLYVTAGRVVRYGNRLWEAQASFLTSSFSTELSNGQWVEISPAGPSQAYEGTPTYIAPGEARRVAQHHQWIVQGSMTVDGSFTIEGELIIL
jgi:hypothetical protein